MTRFMMTLTVASLMICGSAMADLSSLTPWTDSLGHEWHGTAVLSGQDPDSPGSFLSANIEWVVQWVPAAEQFKYTYQMTSTGGVAITLLGVPMLSSNEAQNIGATLMEAGNLAPTAMDFQPATGEPTLAAWSFSGLTMNKTTSP